MPTRRPGGRRGDTTAAGLNRYPEPQPQALVARLAALYGVPAAMLLVGRGSDEAIDLLSRIYLRAGTDAILQCPPTFGMYRVAAHIQGAGVVEVPLRPRARLEPRSRAAARGLAPAHEARVSVLAQQSDRQLASSSARSRRCARRSTARPSW